VSQRGQSLRQRFNKHTQKSRYDRQNNTIHDHFCGGAYRGTENITIQVLLVLQTFREGKQLPNEKKKDKNRTLVD